MKKILVIGATGQIGSELTPELRDRYGSENVVAGGHRKKPAEELLDAGPYITLDAREIKAIAAAVTNHRIDTIFHLAAMLSAAAESRPQLAWELNMNGLRNVLEVARTEGCAVFFPSSIGAFGPSTPPDNTPQLTIQRPTTIYGITKTAGELLCDYYHLRYGVDTRGVRFPGLISFRTPPGGGTTDYAVEMFHAALRGRTYACPLDPATRLDMMYMPDGVRAARQIMEADPAKLQFRNAYNITAMSFAPDELATEIRKHIPDFAVTYVSNPVQQAIADGWPNRMDDSAARTQWGWEPHYDLPAMTADMLAKLPEMRAGGSQPQSGAGTQEQN
jgi:nucleoside-diphosphate-sugar epimerase